CTREGGATVTTANRFDVW
nr:immunoglobulin heavy chain junction region [Macaca mulatta]